MEAVPDFPQFFNRDGADPLDGRKQDRNRLLRTVEVFHERGMIDASAIPVLAPNGPRMRPVDVADSGDSDDGCGWACGVNPEPRAIGEFGNAAAQLNGFRSVQNRIRINGMDRNKGVACIRHLTIHDRELLPAGHWAARSLFGNSMVQLRRVVSVYRGKRDSGIELGCQTTSRAHRSKP